MERVLVSREKGERREESGVRARKKVEPFSSLQKQTKAKRTVPRLIRIEPSCE